MYTIGQYAESIRNQLHTSMYDLYIGPSLVQKKGHSRMAACGPIATCVESFIMISPLQK